MQSSTVEKQSLYHDKQWAAFQNRQIFYCKLAGIVALTSSFGFPFEESLSLSNFRETSHSEAFLYVSQNVTFSHLCLLFITTCLNLYHIVLPEALNLSLPLLNNHRTNKLSKKYSHRKFVSFFYQFIIMVIASNRRQITHISKSVHILHATSETLHVHLWIQMG